jgi:hypothetical protein
MRIVCLLVMLVALVSVTCATPEVVPSTQAVSTTQISDPVRVNGLEVQIVCSIAWTLPKSSKSEDIPLQIWMTNKTDKRICVNLSELQIILIDSGGNERQKPLGSNASVPIAPVTIDEGQSLTLDRPVKFERAPDGFLLEWNDGSGFIWSCNELMPERYSLQVLYQNAAHMKEPSKMGMALGWSTGPFWVGRIVTAPLAVVIDDHSVGATTGLGTKP